MWQALPSGMSRIFPIEFEHRKLQSFDTRQIFDTIGETAKSCGLCRFSRQADPHRPFVTAMTALVSSR